MNQWSKSSDVTHSKEIDPYFMNSTVHQTRHTPNRRVLACFSSITQLVGGALFLALLLFMTIGTRPSIAYSATPLFNRLGQQADLAPNECSTTPNPPTTRFAVIGDFGASGRSERDVTRLVKSWSPEFIITTGDNTYSDGGTFALIDKNVGQYYWEYIYPYTGIYTKSIGWSVTPVSYNRFWPAPGNHDWNKTTDLGPYRTFFSLPNNERYYTVEIGPLAFFALDSDPREPDGVISTSVQATWLQTQLVASTKPWKIVYFHHPPYSSGEHGSSLNLRWPFKQWGASIVLSGHDHNYERFSVDGLTYIVNGVGGASLRPFKTVIADSLVRYADDFGAQLVEANQEGVAFQFYTRAGVLIDTVTLGCPVAIAASTLPPQSYLPIVQKP